jgi:serine/threonine protein kinase
MPIWKRDETIQNGRFLIKKRLGEGGFGITYLAEEPATGKQVVIKTLNANRQNAENFKDIQVKFVNEALTLTGLRHPQIVRVKEMIQEDDLWGMVMEYIEGMELSDLVLDRGQLNEAEALGYIDKIAQALDYVHQQGILHRDVKPNNIMLRTGNQDVILIDFGLARDFIDGKTLSMTNFVTHGYAPPEQYQERGRFAAYSDVYALAATIYHLLTGQPPIPANIRQSYNTDLPEPKKYNLAVSDRVNHAIMQGLSIDHNQRPQNMTEFRELLGLVIKSVNKEPILDAEAYLERGKVKLESGDKQGALADNDKAIQLDPNLAHAYLNRGIVKYALDDIQGALADYNKAAKLYQDQGEIQCHETLLKLIETFKIMIVPGKEPILNAEAYFERGKGKSELGDKQGALADYDKAIELNPNFANAYHHRGNIKSDLGDKQGALSDYNKASELDPLGLIILKNNSYKLGRSGVIGGFDRFKFIQYGSVKKKMQDF